MSAHPTTLIARKSVRARLGRTIAILLAITAGVSFVVGSFVLADSLRKTFDELFTELSANLDLRVRSGQAFETSTDVRDAFDPAIAEQIGALDGVASAEPTISRFAQLLDADGDAIGVGGSPTIGVSWDGSDITQSVEVKSGTPPTGPDQIAIDKSTADREDFELGDELVYITDNGRHTGTLTATVGTSKSDSFGGASVVAVDLATAMDVFGTEGKVDTIDIAVTDGADVATVQTEIEGILPPTLEVVDRQTVVDESNEQVGAFINAFGTGLLIFAFITAFVSAFIINNVFQITIGQRLRELALLRAVRRVRAAGAADDHG